MSGRLRELYLGIDVGTQGTKALLYNAEDGEVVARATRTYGLIEGLPPGHAEQHPATWLDAAAGAVQDLKANADLEREVKGVGVSGQQHGAVLIGADYGIARSAKLWCDTSTAEEAETLSAALGRKIPAGFTAPKLRYVANREPSVWEKTAHVVLPHDFLNACLVHDFFTEAGDASGTGYFDPSTGEYDPRAVEATAPDLAAKLPRLVPCDAVAGEIVPTSAERFGLAPGTPVSAGGGDNMMSAIGSGATRPGVITCSLGTSGTIFGFTESHVACPDGAVAAFRASSALRSGEEPGHLPLLCVMNCTGPLEEIRSLTGKTHDELTAAATAEPTGAGGALFVPYLAGERVPDLPHASGQLLGLRTGSLQPGTLYRAALEGVALNMAWGLERMRKVGLDPKEIRLVGGAARNPLWREVLSSAFNCDVVVLEETETAALGAAIQACAAVQGRHVDEIAQSRGARRGAVSSPDAAAVSVYAAKMQSFKRAVNKLDATND